MEGAYSATHARVRNAECHPNYAHRPPPIDKPHHTHVATGKLITITLSSYSPSSAHQPQYTSDPSRARRADNYTLQFTTCGYVHNLHYCTYASFGRTYVLHLLSSLPYTCCRDFILHTFCFPSATKCPLRVPTTVVLRAGSGSWLDHGPLRARQRVPQDFERKGYEHAHTVQQTRITFIHNTGYE